MSAPSADILARPLSEATLVFLDVETTGLYPATGDRVCELALIRRQPGLTEQEFVTFIDPEREISPDAFAVNKITPDMLTGAPRFPELLEQVSTFLSDAVLVAHNAPFDLGFLRSEYIRAGHRLPDLPVLDTLALARNRFNFVSNSLSAVARQLDVKQPPRLHRALADCRITQQVLDAMIRSLFGKASPSVATVLGLLKLPYIPVPNLAELDGKVSPVLIEMLKQECDLQITYVAKDGRESTRPIKVKQVVRLAQHFYLVAYCLPSHEERSFRMDRILGCRPLDAKVASGTEES